MVITLNVVLTCVKMISKVVLEEKAINISPIVLIQKYETEFGFMLLMCYWSSLSM